MSARRVGVVGALGRMGEEVRAAVAAHPELEVVGAVAGILVLEVRLQLLSRQLPVLVLVHFREEFLCMVRHFLRDVTG